MGHSTLIIKIKKGLRNSFKNIDMQNDILGRIKTLLWLDSSRSWGLLWKLLLFVYSVQESKSPANYERYVSAALNRLHEEVPRMLVNLVPVYDVGDLNVFTDNVICEAFQQ